MRASPGRVSLNKNAFLNSYLDNIGIASVNNALHTIPQLTVNSYINSIQQAVVLTGTLNPGYNPPDVNTPLPQKLAADTIYLAEHHLYGSSRLGIKTNDRDLYKNIYGEVPTGVGGGGTGPNPVWGVADSSLSRKRPWFSYGFADWIKKDKADEYTGSVYNLSLDTLREVRHLGRKQYEMTDHLGNVLATVLDRRSGYGSQNNNYIGYFANLASVSDYYPFGFGMKERNKEYSWYRSGFNGKEKDDEVYGKGNFQDYGFRMYDTRLARFISVDPLTKKFPELTTFQFASNTPIQAIDLDGAEGYHYTIEFNEKTGKSHVKLTNIVEALAFDITINQWVFYRGQYYNFGQEWNYAPYHTFDNVKVLNDKTIEEIDLLFENRTSYAQTVASKDAYDKEWNDKMWQAAAGRQYAQNVQKNTKAKNVSSTNSSKYNYGKYGSNFNNHVAKIRSDLNVPSNWIYKKNKNDAGVRFIDPDNPHNSIRVSPGTNGATHQASQTPNVKWYKNGSPMDVNGNPIKSTTGNNQNKTAEGHIPMEKFKYKD